MAAVAPEPLLPGYNRLACCFNKRGRFWGVKRRSDEEEMGVEEEDGGGGGWMAGNHIRSHWNSWGSGGERHLTFAAHGPVHTWEQSGIIACSREAVTSMQFVFNCPCLVWKVTQLKVQLPPQLILILCLSSDIEKWWIRAKKKHLMFDTKILKIYKQDN